MIEKYPYTDFNEYNLDWVIKKIRELAAEWASVKTDWSDMQQAFTDLKNFVEDYFESDHIREVVSDVIDEMAEDGTLLDILINASQKIKSQSVTPIYIGDCMSPATSLPSAVLQIGDNFIMFEPNTRTYNTTNRTNLGKIRVFSISQNKELTAQAVTRTMGHANSAAYDGNKIYVVPIWDASSGAEVPLNVLYTFDTNLNPLTDVVTVSTPMGVSYDPVAEKLYYYDYNHDIYEYNGSGWDLIKRINNPVVNLMFAEQYNQDFAVYNGLYYISSPSGNIISGKIYDDSADPVAFFNCNYYESTGRYTLGELEGFEFSHDGHFYAVDYAQLYSDIKDAFIIELNITGNPCSAPAMSSAVYRLTSGTLTLSEATQIKFSLNTYEIRSMAQLSCKRNLDNYYTVQIPANNNVIDDYSMRISTDIMLDLVGSYTCKRLWITNNVFMIHSDVTTNQLTFSQVGGIAIMLTNGSRLGFIGKYAINVSLPNASTGNNFVNIGQDYNIISVRQVPVSLESLTLAIETTAMNTGLYLGTTRIYP